MFKNFKKDNDMTSPLQTIGFRAEDEAQKYLTDQGLHLIEKNFTCFLGEIDLIMQDEHQIVFVEVRYRSRQNFGSALESITPAKIKKIIRTAIIFLQFKKWLHRTSSRFDVITIDNSKDGRKINWIKHAFTP
jgi:putative endonuclease